LGGRVNKRSIIKLPRIAKTPLPLQELAVGFETLQVSAEKEIIPPNGSAMLEFSVSILRTHYALCLSDSNFPVGVVEIQKFDSTDTKREVSRLSLQGCTAINDFE
jgi:hypothetical protein